MYASAPLELFSGIAARASLPGKTRFFSLLFPGDPLSPLCELDDWVPFFLNISPLSTILQSAPKSSGVLTHSHRPLSS